MAPKENFKEQGAAVHTELLKLCDEEAVQEGRAVLASEGYMPLADIVGPESVILRARVVDTFQFVDHPQVVLDAGGEKILSFSCDCPWWHSRRSFCPHCAALLLDRDVQLCTGSAATAEEMPEEAGDAPQEDQPAELGVMDFSYTFCNSKWDLYPNSRNPRIPLERYIQMFGNTARARAIYNAAGFWGGSCFGMTATSTMFQQPNNDIWPESFSADAQIPSELKLDDRSEELDMTLHTFIESVHILQSCRPVALFRNLMLNDPDCMEKLVQCIKDFENGEAGPVGMAVWKNPRFSGGHSVLPYHVESVSETEDRLHIYDPNYPLTTRYAELKKDEQGHYLSWRFPMGENNIYGSETGGQLAFDPYAIYNAAWDMRGGPEMDNFLNIGDGVAILNADGEVLARVTEDGVESFRKEIYRIPVVGGDASGRTGIMLPAGIYTFRLEDPQQEELALELAGVNLSVNLSTSAREAVVRVEEQDMIAFVQISEPNSRYEIDILNTAGQAHEEASLNGVVGETPLLLLQKAGKLYAKGLVRSASLLINGESAPLSVIGELVEQREQKELLVNGGSEEKPEDAQN